MAQECIVGTTTFDNPGLDRVWYPETNKNKSMLLRQPCQLMPASRDKQLEWAEGIKALSTLTINLLLLLIRLLESVSLILHCLTPYSQGPSWGAEG